MKKVLFIDRDGTLIAEPPDEQVDSLEKLEFLPGVFRALGDIAATGEYELVIVTNQDGLGTASFPEETFAPAHEAMLRAFAGEGIHFAEVLIDRSFPADNAPTRKPGTGLLARYTTGEYDLAASYVIGDRRTDVELARNVGAKALWITPDTDAAGFEDVLALATTSWQDIAQFLLMPPRRAIVERVTKETQGSIDLCVDGTGKADISTGLGFFDHMLEQIAFHARLDITLRMQADLHVDEHHCMEDTALLLGRALRQALGNKVGIERYGFALPMDDALAQVALDMGGRSFLAWDVEFRRERIGDVPTEMFQHVFKSLCDAALCTLHIAAHGTNEHHKIEAVCKAFARALRAAVQRDARYRERPSTKGVV